MGGRRGNLGVWGKRGMREWGGMRRKKREGFRGDSSEENLGGRGDGGNGDSGMGERG